jgi:3-(3-hydroxy-phenyl)propionate hydroxylase
MDVTPPPGNGESQDVVVAGGGPVGLTLALDLARRGQKVVVLTKHSFISGGSKAICFAKRSLEIFDRLGVGARVREKGVRWSRGHVYRGASRDPIYSFELDEASGQKNPAFVNIQQFYVEEYLVEALAAEPLAEVRWGHEVLSVEATDQSARLEIGVGTDRYTAECRYLIACDGHRSPVRTMLGLSFNGRVFQDNFLIADVRFKREMPAERHFWFDPPWPGASALMHRQPNDVWRLDFQIGRDIDQEAAVLPQNVDPFVRGMLGEDTAFEYVWLSVYTFQCRRMGSFVHGPVVFAGDAAHLVSPFGARGCNGGIADADNLGWKLARVLNGKSPPALLGTYNTEATHAADVNIQHSTRATDFMTPKSAAQRAYRDAVLALAALSPEVRPYVNSGRLSTAVSYPASPLSTPDRDDWEGAGVPPGAPLFDTPTDDGWLSEKLSGDFLLITAEERSDLPMTAYPASTAVRHHYALHGNAAALLRPDGHIAARWKHAQADDVRFALRKAALTDG